ncbi:hypothetical protein AAF712_009903 [Marasmius tenuissimus]|uniref:Uncharacterized protein n=1 Tax=Marasmius tenuissimus TaxID=585030 RepID=A0ABR2ZPH2_9AGAR
MASSPLTPSDSQRHRAILRFVGHHEQVLETNRGLMRAESERQNAEENLRAAENRVKLTVDELDVRFDAMARAYADLKLVFSNENAQPARIASTSLIPPPTPSHSRATQHQPPQSSPTRNPPPSTEDSTPQSSQSSQATQPPQTQNNYAAYVVYSGKDGVMGIFYSWHSKRGLEGAKQYITSDHHLVKGFGDVELAQEFYNEYADLSAVAILATPVSQQETFVLLEGVLPGVYHSRKSLLWKGLQFRGGVVEHYTGSGSEQQARQHFTWARENNELRVTHQPEQVD